MEMFKGKFTSIVLVYFGLLRKKSWFWEWLQICPSVDVVGNTKADRTELTMPGGKKNRCVRRCREREKGAGKTEMSNRSVLRMKPPLLSAEHFKYFKP